MIFIYAGVKAQRTHGCAFDSIVLYLCAWYNLMYIFEDLIWCTPAGQLLKIVCYTAGILYIFFNFENMLKSMERDLDLIKDSNLEDSQASDRIRGDSDDGFNKVENSNTKERRASFREINTRDKACWGKCRRP